MENRVFPFGKYKDQPLSIAPPSYLRWMVRDCEEQITPAFREALLSELYRRRVNKRAQEQEPPARPVRVPVGVSPTIAAQLIAAGRRALAAKVHPDVGGNTTAMQQVNAAADWLEAQAHQLLMTGGSNR